MREPTRPPRLDQAVHHLLTIESAIDYLERTQGRFSRLLGDEDLRSRSRAGRAGGEAQAGSMADGQLWFEPADGSTLRTVLIEVLAGKYSDEVIAEKVKGLAGQGVIFTAPTAGVVARTVRLTGVTPLRIGRSILVPGADHPQLHEGLAGDDPTPSDDA